MNGAATACSLLKHFIFGGSISVHSFHICEMCRHGSMTLCAVQRKREGQREEVTEGGQMGGRNQRSE